MFDTFKSRLILHGSLTSTTALRIGAGQSSTATETNLPVIKDALGAPYIPGSSFKGVLRSRIESLLRSINSAAACNPVLEDERCIHLDTMNEQKAKFKDDDLGLTQWVEEQTCLACSLFGSTWLASRAQIKDWQVDRRYWFSQYLIRDGVSIDRDTETAGDKLYYNYEVVPAGTVFNGTIIVENGDPWQLGLLLLGLREFNQGLPIGGGTSRGLGGVTLEWDRDKELQSSYVDASNIWGYLEDQNAGQAITDALRQTWKQAMLAKLKRLPRDGDDNAQTTH